MERRQNSKYSPVQISRPLFEHVPPIAYSHLNGVRAVIDSIPDACTVLCASEGANIKTVLT